MHWRWNVTSRLACCCRVGKRAVGRPKTPTNDCQPTAAADQLQAVASKGTPAAASAAGSGKAAGASSHRQTGTAAAKRRSTGEVTQAVTEEEPAVPALSPAHPSLELQHVHGYSGECTPMTAAPATDCISTRLQLCALTWLGYVLLCVL